MTRARINLTREQILGFRRQVGALDERLPGETRSLRRAAWAGLQDSMPRAALLSIHARVDGTGPTTWEDPSLVQVWGPRFSVFVVAAQDHAVFTLGRSHDGSRRRLAEDLTARLDDLLDGGEMTYGEAGRALGEHPNRLRYAALTGRVLIRWDGARQPTIRVVAAPEIDRRQAQFELARRYLRVFGPATPEAFATWAGVALRQGIAVFDSLLGSLIPVRTPIGEAWVLAADEDTIGVSAAPEAPARLLPSGDAYFLLWGADRELLVPEASHRDALWTPRVWPGAVLVRGEVVGTWRRAQGTVTIQTWRRLAVGERKAVEAEAGLLPLPGVAGDISVRWDD